jgi:hypothetical protein
MMGELKMLFRGRIGLFLFLLLAAGAVGCESHPSYSHRRLISHQAMLDFAGLKPVESVEAVKASIQPPENWTALPVRKSIMYTSQQWRSPSRTTGVGIIHIRLPFPLPTRTLIWMAKNEYAKKDADGRLLGQWTDRIGREWVEAENAKYHVRGYIAMDGRDAWFIYSGYKTAYGLNAAELSIAARSVETVTPHTGRVPERAEGVAVVE